MASPSLEILAAAMRTDQPADFRSLPSEHATLDVSEFRRLMRAATGKVHIQGARFDAFLDLSDLTADGGGALPSLVLEACLLPDGVSLESSAFHRVSLRDCQTPRLAANDVRIETGLNLSGLAPVNETCTVELWGARIGGLVSLEGAHLASLRGGPALEMTQARIGGSLYLRKGFRSRGSVRLQNASVGALLDLTGSEISTFQGPALVLDRCDVGQTLRLRDCTLRGSITAVGLRSGGNVEFHDPQIVGSDGRPAVVLTSVSIAGDLSIGKFRPDADCRIEGDLVMPGAAVGGRLTLREVTLAAGRSGKSLLDLSRSRSGQLAVQTLAHEGSLEIDLRGARSDRLQDDLSHGWGDAEATLRIDGFSYDRLVEPEAFPDRWLPLRLAWISKSRGISRRYQPQPYEQLAETLQVQGYRSEARDVRVAQKWHELVTRTPLYLKPFVGFYGLAFRFGHSPLSAMVTLFLAVAIGWGGVVAANISGALVLDTMPVASVSGRNGQPGLTITNETSVRAEIPCTDAVDPLYYALDIFVPLIDFNQERKCEIRGSPEFATWRLLKTLYVLMGWIVVSLSVITFSGAVRHGRID